MRHYITTWSNIGKLPLPTEIGRFQLCTGNHAFISIRTTFCITSFLRGSKTLFQLRLTEVWNFLAVTVRPLVTATRMGNWVKEAKLLFIKMEVASRIPKSEKRLKMDSRDEKWPPRRTRSDVRWRYSLGAGWKGWEGMSKGTRKGPDEGLPMRRWQWPKTAHFTHV